MVAVARQFTIDPDIARTYWEAQAAHPDAASVWMRVVRSLEQSWFRRQIAQYVRTPGLAVDVGCGDGHWTELLAQMFGRVMASDLAEGFVVAARQRLDAAGLSTHATIVRSDAAHAPIPSGADTIVVGGVMEYLGDYEIDDVLARARAALSPGGAIYVRGAVARSDTRSSRLTPAFQAIYRPSGWYDVRFTSAGLRIVHSATASDVIGSELARRSANLLRGPLRSLLRATRCWWPVDDAYYLLIRA